MAEQSTIRLFETQSHLKLFFGVVEGCETIKEKNRTYYKIVLDQTAFFPEGGGQNGDCGFIASGENQFDDFFETVEDNKSVVTNETVSDETKTKDAEKKSLIPQAKKIKDTVSEVFDTQEKNGIIYHYSTKPFAVGETVTGLLDFDVRFRRMQNHTGEHIVSGIINKYFGFDNVGFHMGSSDVTLDVNGVLTKEEIDFVESEANRAVIENVPVYAQVYSGDELFALEYRSKLDLTENVRIVTVEGFDKCACCAPHVETTGEIGIIKITAFGNYKQGVRIHMLCGYDAILDYEKKLSQTKAVSNLLSVKPDELSEGVSRILEEVKKEKQESNSLKNTIANLLLKNAKAENTACLFTDINDPVFLRYLATGGADIFGKCGVFCLVSENNYRYVCVGKNTDMRSFAKELNSALDGRGGGDTELIQGSVKASEEKIRNFFSGF